MLMPNRDLVSIARLTSGRRILALRLMRQAAVDLDNQPLIGRIDECVAHDRYTRRVDSDWTGFTALSSYSPRLTAIDNLADPTVTSTRDMALLQARGRPPTHPRAILANRFVQEAFPNGVAAITSLPYPDQAAAMEDLMERLRGPLAPMVTELGLSDQVAYLGEITVEYRAAVEEGNGALTFDYVRATRDRGQDLFTGVVALVIATYYDLDNPAHVEARKRLLAPVMAQDTAIRAYLSRRTSVRDVDPETGEEEGEDDASGEGEAGDDAASGNAGDSEPTDDDASE